MRVVYGVRRALPLLAAMALATLLVSSIAFALNDITCPNRPDNAFGNLCMGTGKGDLMVGTAQADDMRGLAGDDTMRAGENGDRLVGNQGDDRLSGSAGDDRYVFYAGWGQDAIVSETSTSGLDALRFSGVSTGIKIALDDQHPTIALGATSGQNKVTFASNLIENARGGTGPDVIAGSAASNTLTGNAGNDKLQGEDGNDTYRRVVGQDVIDDASGSADTLVLDDHSSSNATFAPIDGADADNNYDALSIDVGGGNVVLIKGYFDNSSARALASGPGTGLIENIGFSDGTLSFGDIRDLAGAGEVQPPVANDDTASTEEDTAKVVDVLANDTGQNLSVKASSLGDPAHGTATLITSGPDQGKVNYEPDDDYNNTAQNPDTFTYEACDDVVPVECDEATVSVTVNAVNDQPTDISLSPSSVEENQPSGTTVGTLSTTDVDAGDSHTYALVSGAGDDDNASFQITDDKLQTNATFDFETKSSYTVRVQTDDGHGGTFEKQLTISIANANDMPTDITLSNASVDENLPAGTEVGTLSTTDQDAGDSFTYELVSGTGDTDNASFQISGSKLQTAGPLNFEAGATRSVRVRTSDGHGGTFEESFTITLTNANDAPTNLALSNDTVEENQPSGTTVGALSADDEDGDTPTFAFVTGTGDNDNGSFTISGDTLKTNATFDFEAKDTYTIRVVADDGQGGTVEKQFTIKVTDANDAPTDISLSNSSVAENQPAGATVGTLSTTDQDTADAHTYTLVAGAGDDDNASFQISDDELQTNATFDFEAKSSYTVRVQTDDGQGGTFEKQLTISVANANDAPTDISLSNSSVVEHQPSGTTIGTFSTTDQDAADTFTYALVSGSGDTDNASFQISSSELQTDADLSAGTYSIRVQTDDGHPGGTFEEQFTITVVPPNFAPTDISLSNNTVAENQPSGTDVGTLTTTDPDSGDTHTYSLVAGTGDDDNASFQISGDKLQTNATFDFETKDSYSIRIRTDDGNGGTFEEQFTIKVTDANDAPTDIDLSNSSVAENLPSGTDVGTFSSTDQDTADTHTYTLVSGAGDADNGSFQISGGTLKTNAQFDFEAKNSYSIRVRTDDGHGGTFEKQFTISITNANDTPTDISLSNSSVAENLPSGTDVGTFSTSDQDAADTHTYTLVSGTGSTDNGQFTISGSTLKTNAQFNFEAKNSYTIRVRTDDGHGGTLEEQFTITVTNANDAPTDIALSNSSVAENLPSGTTVGTLSTTDEDAANTHTYSLVSGAGDTDNASFQISGSTVQTNAQFDFETKNSYAIRLQTSDGQGGTFQKQFTVSVTNVNDAPTDIALSKSDVDENLPSGTPVGTFSTTDQDSGDTHTYALVTGTGSTDNASFQIVNGQLRTSASFNFEAKNSYSIRVRTTDNGTPSKSFEEAFTISINDVNDAPVAGTDSYSGVVGNTKASVGVTVTGEPVVALTGNVLTFNDSDEDTTFPHTLSAVAETVSSTGGGTATISSNGSFTFVPGVGDKNQSDTFTYHVTDGQATSSGTVTVGISNSLVWYVDNSKATNGDGRSTSPFNTLGGINGAGGSGDSDGTGDTLFLYQGSGTYTGGLALEANQRLIGQAANLTVGSATLLTGDPTKRPTITNTGADVIDLDDANEVRGLQVDPQGTGGGIAGATGDTGGGTIDDVRINDTGTAGTQPGLELDATTGTFNVSNLTVSTSGATGVRLNNAGTVNFLPSGTISITTSGARGLDATGTAASPTNMGSGSVFDDITVTGSGTGGVSMSGTTGATTFGDGSGTDLNLTTTSGATPAFSLSNAGTVAVPSGGTANVSATGGPAIDVTGTGGASLAFDDVDSTNSTGDGVNIAGLGSGTFTANNSSTITNAATIDFDLDGGTGNVTYDGTITDDVGQLVRIANTTGGIKDFNGAITDGNDGDGNGISLTTNTGATIRFDGGLTLSTGANAAFNATGGGTVAVTDANGAGNNPDNTIATTTGTPLNVQNTTIHSDGLTFRSIAANGSANGIALNNTGAGGLSVTGTGTTAGSGGTIQNTSNRGASFISASNVSLKNMNFTNAGNTDLDATNGGLSTGDNLDTNAAIHLQSVSGATLDRIAISGGAEQGINGNNVSNFVLSNSSITNAGNAADEDNIHFFNMSGTSSISDTALTHNSGGGDDNLNLQTQSGTLNLTISGGSAIGTGGGVNQLGSGYLFGIRGTTNATISFNNASSTNNFSGGIVADAFDSATMNLTVQNSTSSGNNDQLSVSAGDNSNVDLNASSNTLSSVGTGDFVVVSLLGSAFDNGFTFDARLQNNNISVANGLTADGISMFNAGGGLIRSVISGNTITYAGTQRAINVQGGQDGAGTTAATITGNRTDIQLDGSGNAVTGILAQVAVASPSGDNSKLCADIGGAGTLANTFTHSQSVGTMPAGEIRLRQRFVTTVQLPGYGGANNDNAAVVSYLAARNTLVNNPAATATNEVGVTPGAGGFVNTPSGAACAQPSP